MREQGQAGCSEATPYADREIAKLARTKTGARTASASVACFRMTTLRHGPPG
jgi:hypothetical protein